MFSFLFSPENKWLLTGVLVPLLVAIIVIMYNVYNRHKDKQEKRIEFFVHNFKSHLQNGYFLEILIPSGISNLKNNKEIDKALNMVKNTIGRHPLRKWNEPIKKIGYKRFFLAVSNSGKNLNKHSIENFINQFLK
jgi:hypothetical protein